MSNAEFFNFLDYIYIVILFFSTVAGFIRGFVRDFFSTCAWFGSGFAAVFIAPYLIPFFCKIIHNLTIARGVAILMSYLIILITSLLIVGALSKNVKDGSLSGVDRAVGILFGLFRGIGALVCFCFLMFTFEISRNKYSVIKNSKITTILFNVLGRRIQQSPKSVCSSKVNKIGQLEKSKLPIKKSTMIEKDKAASEYAPLKERSVLSEIKDFIKQRTDGEVATVPISDSIASGKKQKDKFSTHSAPHQGRCVPGRIFQKMGKARKEMGKRLDRKSS